MTDLVQRAPRTTRWVITVGATALSAYALDGVATAAGLALAASHLLRDLDQVLLVGFLVATYVAWGAGLRVNLHANWALLEDTGTSTNAFSKAGYELSKLRDWSLRARKLSTAIGYVGTELLKEAPYYAGAFGAALVSDSVSSKDALIFLGGTNLGAALYEYGLGRGTRVFLRVRKRLASFESEWVPKEYLADYYSVVEPDELETIAFFVDAMDQVEPGKPILFFGVGPTLHHVFLAAGKASEIHLADYLPANLEEIERWLRRDPDAHDWAPFVRYTLECEGHVAPSDEQVRAREELVRAKTTRLLQVDARRANPFADGGERNYETVISPYCADSATDDRAIWATMVENIAGLVRPGGTFITAALRRCRYYVVGGKRFPSADVDEHAMRAVLEPGFGRRQAVEIRQLSGHEALGYSGIVLAWAERAGA